MAPKKTDDTSEPIDPRDEEIAILKAQNDQILDFLAEQREQLDALKAAQVGTAAETVKRDDVKAGFDAELEALAEEFKDYPLISAFEQRVLVGADANTDIRLRDEASVVDDPQGERRIWKLRWFNFDRPGRANQAAQEGYQKVRWDEVTDQDVVPTATRTDEFVRRGDRGLETLHKMPLKLFNYKKRRDAAARRGLLESTSQLQDVMANRVSTLAGAAGQNADQAGSFAHRQIDLTITKGATEHVTV